MLAACIQLCSGQDIDKNIEHTDALIRASHNDGAQFIATPENTHLMHGGTKELFAKISYENECKALAYFKLLAKELSIDLLIGSLAIKLSDKKAANRSFLIGKNGQVKASYDKIHLFDVDISEQETWRESDNYTAGTTPIIGQVGDMGLGLSICYDLRFASLYKHYAHMGAHMMTVPAAFTQVTGKAHWLVLLRARAIETSSYVIAPAQGGLHENGRTTWGHSMIIDPWGEVIAHLYHDAPGYCMAEISQDRVISVRKKIPAWQQETSL